VACQLDKKKVSEPGPSVEGAHASVAVVAGHELLELSAQNELDELRKTVDRATA
jgi:hypothetical protein